MYMMMVLALLATAPVSRESVEAARQLVERTARSFYDGWGQSPANDARLANQLMTPTLIAEVKQKRAQSSIDPLTCMPGRAVVERAALVPGSTTARLIVDVSLRGAQGAAVAQWTLDVSPQGTRLSAVRCTTPSASSSLTSPPTPAPAPPTQTSQVTPTSQTSQTSTGAGLVIARQPATEDERIAVRFLLDAIAAGDDPVRLKSLVSHFTREERRSYLGIQKDCVETARNGDPLPVRCAGNGLTCGAEEGSTLVKLRDMSGSMWIELKMNDGSERTLKLQLGEAVYGWDCFDSTPKSKSQSDSTTGTSTLFESTFSPGHCSGTAICAGACTETGCYRGRHGTCLGAAVPCAGRGQSSCFGPCYWTQ